MFGRASTAAFSLASLGSRSRRFGESASRASRKTYTAKSPYVTCSINDNSHMYLNRSIQQFGFDFLGILGGNIVQAHSLSVDPALRAVILCGTSFQFAQGQREVRLFEGFLHLFLHAVEILSQHMRCSVLLCITARHCAYSRSVCITC